MFIETALKNYVLEVILEESKSFNFNDVYQNLLTGFKNHPIGSANYSKSIKNRLAVRDIVYRELTSNYDRLPVKHYCDKDESVPMWAIFEVLNLGQFGFFTSCLSDNVKIKVSHELGLPPQCNTGGSLLPVIVFTLKDIRNSIAHNIVIFDARFKSGDVKRSLSRCLEMSTSIQNITFGNIFDYIILVVYILKCLRVSKSEINKLVSSFEEMTEQLRRSVPVQIYSRIIPTNTRRDLVKLSIFVRS
jgi:abortive infection bacteriophage resistance protein